MEPPASARLTDITAPTLLLVGAKDVANFVQVSEILEAGLPGAKRVVLPDVAHLVSMERPDEFNDLVLDFLSED